MALRDWRAPAAATRAAAAVATATVATPATHSPQNGPTVATVATVAVADDGAGRHYRWRLAFADRPPLEICSVPEMTAAEAMARYPGASVEPLPDAAA